MKTAIYPGSFDPLHDGHKDIIEKTLKVFDKLYLAQAINYAKQRSTNTPLEDELLLRWTRKNRVEVIYIAGFLHQAIDDLKMQKGIEVHAVIRGLRNGYDLQHEQNQQYHYEDLGLRIPIVYFICDRTLGHISSTAIREISKIQAVQDRQHKIQKAHGRELTPEEAEKVRKELGASGRI